ncbi:MAG: hypothetical protein M3327_07745 [Actinomycetota bacterium]|nr:hypothetical protein [Actinomycetota bacterium]
MARRWTYSSRIRPAAGRWRDPPLVLRFERENPRWGYQRIVGELNGLGVTVSATTVWKILHQAGIGPAGERSGLSWRVFLRQQAKSMPTSTSTRPKTSSASPTSETSASSRFESEIARTRTLVEEQAGDVAHDEFRMDERCCYLKICPSFVAQPLFERPHQRDLPAPCLLGLPHRR